MPPPDKTPAIIHEIRILYAELYRIGSKLSKRDKLGIHALLEEKCIDALDLALQAAFQQHTLKCPTLESLRIKLEVLKHLIRSEHELVLIDEKTYLRLSEQVIEISKGANRWIAYLANPHTQKGVSRG